MSKQNFFCQKKRYNSNKYARIVRTPSIIKYKKYIRKFHHVWYCKICNAYHIGHTEN